MINLFYKSTVVYFGIMEMADIIAKRNSILAKRSAALDKVYKKNELYRAKQQWKAIKINDDIRQRPHNHYYVKYKRCEDGVICKCCGDEFIVHRDYAVSEKKRSNKFNDTYFEVCFNESCRRPKVIYCDYCKDRFRMHYYKTHSIALSEACVLKTKIKKYEKAN